MRARPVRELPGRGRIIRPGRISYSRLSIRSSIVPRSWYWSRFFRSRYPAGTERALFFHPGMLILINNYVPDGPRRGELVFLDDGSAVRVIARGGDSVKYENNIFYINGRNLPLGYLADDIIARFASDREDIVSETGESGPYPVQFKQSQEITLQGIGGTRAKGTLPGRLRYQAREGFCPDSSCGVSLRKGGGGCFFAECMEDRHECVRGSEINGRFEMISLFVADNYRRGYR